MGKYRQVDKLDMENADEILSVFQKSLPHALPWHTRSQGRVLQAPTLQCCSLWCGWIIKGIEQSRSAMVSKNLYFEYCKCGILSIPFYFKAPDCISNAGVEIDINLVPESHRCNSFKQKTKTNPVYMITWCRSGSTIINISSGQKPSPV